MVNVYPMLDTKLCKPHFTPLKKLYYFLQFYWKYLSSLSVKFYVEDAIKTALPRSLCLQLALLHRTVYTRFVSGSRIVVFHDCVPLHETLLSKMAQMCTIAQMTCKLILYSFLNWRQIYYLAISMASICKWLPSEFSNSTQHGDFDLAQVLFYYVLKASLEEFPSWFSWLLDIQTR